MTAGWRACWNCRRPAGCGATACARNGRVDAGRARRLRDGITIDGVRYGPIEATLDREQGANVWLTFAIREGKNREVRNVLEQLGLQVNRLIRVSFGPFQLGEFAEGAVEEVGPRRCASSSARRWQRGRRRFRRAARRATSSATRAARRHPRGARAQGRALATRETIQQRRRDAAAEARRRASTKRSRAATAQAGRGRYPRPR